MIAALERSRFRTLLSRAHVLALSDQVVVSIASFLITILLGRFALASELGGYAIGLSVVTSLFCIQESLITTPYTILQHDGADRRVLAGSALTVWAMYSVLAAAAVGMAAAGAPLFDLPAATRSLLWAIALAVPPLLLREFARRFAFAHLQTSRALAIDTAAVFAQLSMLLYLGRNGSLSAVTAWLSLGIASGGAAVAWLCVSRRQFAIQAQAVLSTVARSWKLGQWLFATQLVVAVQSLGIYMLLATMDGLQAAGIFTACMSIALIANPFILGMSNLLVPKFVVAWVEGGSERLRREAKRETLLLGFPLILFCLVVSLPGTDLTLLVYHAQDYAGQSRTVAILALGMLVMAVGMPATNALTSIGRVAELFWTGAAATAVTLALVWELDRHWGLVGVASAILIGNLFRSGTRWAAFLSSAMPRAVHTTTT